MQNLLTISSSDTDGSKSVIRYPGETLSLRMTVKAPASLKTSGSPPVIEAEVLTNVVETRNPNGEWMTYKMDAEPVPTPVGSRSWRRPDAQAAEQDLQIVFFLMLAPTTLGKYRYKMRCRLSSTDGSETSPYIYAGGKEETEFKLKVLPLEPDSQTWTSGPIAVEVYPNVFVGNFMAACEAQILGFSAILNVAEELDVPVGNFATPQPLYKKVGLVDGTIHPISTEHILACVRWLEAREGSKTLIHCRAGQGRSGSIAIAFKCKKFPLLSFDEVVQNIWKAKPDITPHKGLKQTLESIRWD